MKPVREPASTLPEPQTTQDSFPLPVRFGSRTKKTDRVVRDQLPPQKPPGSRLWFPRYRVQHSPRSSTINLRSTLAESGAYSPDRACHDILARAAAPY